MGLQEIASNRRPRAFRVLTALAPGTKSARFTAALADSQNLTRPNRIPGLQLGHRLYRPVLSQSISEPGQGGSANHDDRRCCLSWFPLLSIVTTSSQESNRMRTRCVALRKDTMRRLQRKKARPRHEANND